MHLLKLTDGKPHPRARKPLLTYNIPLDPTESGWQIESIILGNRLGCLFTSTSQNESVDTLVVWDWTTGDLVRVRPIPRARQFCYSPNLQVLSQCGNRSFIFLNEDTVVAGRTMGDGRPSLSFFDLASDNKPVIPFLTLTLPHVRVATDVSWAVRLNLGIPIHHGPELRVQVPFVVNPTQQMLFVLVFIVGSDNIPMVSHSIAVPLSKLRDWARENWSLVEWEHWRQPTVSVPTEDPYRATCTMGSRFVVFDFLTFIVVAPAFAAEPISMALVHNLNPHRLMRVGWDSSGPHCQGIPGVWNTVTRANENGSHRRSTQIRPASTLNVYMTEDNLVILEMVRFGQYTHFFEAHPEIIGPGGQFRPTAQGFILLNTVNFRIKNVSNYSILDGTCIKTLVNN